VKSILRNSLKKISIQYLELRESDLQVVKEIYDFYVINSTATFHKEKVTLQELKDSIPIGHQKYKSFIIKYNQSVCGFCYISQYKKREAYDRTAEITIYLKPEFFGKGIGVHTIKMLESNSFKNGIKVLIGIISEENSASIKLFEKCCYEKCGHYKQVGEKFNRILDVVAYQKVLGE
jgi:phosphinothricin acetyltransferase